MSERFFRVSKAITRRDGRPRSPAMSASSHAGSTQTLDLVRALGACGLDTPSLCAAAGLDPEQVSRARERVPGPVVVRLLEEAESRSGDRLVGLHAAERTSPSGPILYLMLASPRLEESLRSWERFGRLAISSLRVRLDVATASATLSFDLGDETLDASTHLADYLLRSVLRALRELAAFDVAPREVRLRHAAPADAGDAAEFARSFGCEVRFAAADDALVFHRRDLDVASPFANPLIAAEVERLTAALESRLEPRVSFREQVADVARSLIATGVRADRAMVARELRTSEPSLHRALRRESTTFKEVRDGVVWEVAEALLCNPSLKVEALALTVGFADGPTFVKAFKRRFGVSPTRYRERNAASGCDASPSASP
jgi:AraC-like DNA-binding protein